jgi:Flp pilus assembly protein TadG
MRLLHNERGTAMVEFAIVALPLFLILFGIVDFARALNYYNDLTQLAGQGARAAAVDQNPDGGTADANFQNQLLQRVDTPELKQTTPPATICITQMPSTNGDPVSVQASYEFHFLPLIGSTITLSSTQTERFEGLTPHYSDANNASGCP